MKGEFTLFYLTNHNKLVQNVMSKYVSIQNTNSKYCSTINGSEY